MLPAPDTRSRNITVTCFNKYTEATIAAIDLVIQRYAYEPWFNGLLRKLMGELHVKQCDESFNGPLIIIHDQNNGRILNYYGYHYLIEVMEIYNKYRSISAIYLVLALMLTLGFIFIIILFLKKHLSL